MTIDTKASREKMQRAAAVIEDQQREIERLLDICHRAHAILKGNCE